MNSHQIAIINEDYELLKFYRLQHPLALKRIDTLAARIDKLQMIDQLKNDQIFMYRQADTLHFKRYDELNERYFSIVLENEAYIRKNRRWITITSMLAAALTVKIFWP